LYDTSLARLPAKAFAAFRRRKLSPFA